MIKTLRDRHKGADDPDCPQGSDGPFLNDAMINYAVDLVIRMQETVRRKSKIVIGFFSGEGDISAKAFGGITYVHSMGRYIHELEDAYKASPLIGIDPSSLEGATITKFTSNELTLSDGRMLVRRGMNWEWCVRYPDPE